MTRIALIGDSHFDEHSRFAECVRVHEWIARDLRDRGVDLVLHSGDVFERKSTPAERRAVADWLRAVAEVAPVVIVRGNHDVVGDLAIFSRLRGRHPIVVEEAAAVHHVAGVAVACLAWPRKAELLSRVGARGHEESEQGAREALRAVLLGMSAQLRAHDGPRVLLAHAMVRGSRVSTGQPLVGCDMELGLEDLALCEADFYALGHIHLPQAWGVEMAERHRAFDAPVVYPGSPRRTAFGEVESKGYVLVDAARAPLTWERIQTPCAPMLLLTGEFVRSDPGHEPRDVNQVVLLPGQPEDFAGAEIRVRYLVEADHRALAKADEERIRAELVAAGAVAVKIEAEVVARAAARAPEVAQAATLVDKLAALWRVRGQEPAAPRAERLISRVHQLEQDAADAA